MDFSEDDEVAAAPAAAPAASATAASAADSNLESEEKKEEETSVLRTRRACIASHIGVGVDSVRPAEQRDVRDLLAFTCCIHAAASPWSKIVLGDARVGGGCTSGRNASLGERAACQASLHRFGVGVDSVRPAEQRDVRDLLAFTCCIYAAASPWSKIVLVDARVGGGCTSGRNASLGERAACQASLHIASGSAFIVSGRLSSELYVICSRSIASAM